MNDSITISLISVQESEKILKKLSDQREILEKFQKDIYSSDEHLQQSERILLKMSYYWWDPRYWIDFCKLIMQSDI